MVLGGGDTAVRVPQMAPCQQLSPALLPEERARIYSSDSDEGSEEDKAQRLLKAKKLNSDEVSRQECDRACSWAGLVLADHLVARWGRPWLGGVYSTADRGWGRIW